MKIINLTPHPITLFGYDGTKYKEWPKCEAAPRLEQTTEIIEMVEGIYPMTTTVFGECSNLPKQKFGVLFIVPVLIRAAFPDRKDLISPNELVRDLEGNVIGCKSFAVKV